MSRPALRCMKLCIGATASRCTCVPLLDYAAGLAGPGGSYARTFRLASQQCRPDVHHFSAYDLRADQQRVSKSVAVCRPAALDADASMTGRSWASCP